MRTRLAAALLTVLAAALLPGCGTARPGESPGRTASPLPPPTGTRQEVAEKNLLYLWPFTVDHGTIACLDGTNAVFIAPDGATYALNDRAQNAGYPSVEPLRRSGSTGTKVSLGAIRSHALELCGRG